MGGRGLGSGEARADPPATPGCQKRQGGSHLIRRVISPPGQHQTFPQPQHLREPCLSRAVGQGPYPIIPHGWPPNTIAWNGRRTLSMCSYKEAEFVKQKDKFFVHFLPHKEEALGIKERCPRDYMPYIEEQFWRAMGLCLNGLWDFTAWIKQGSYYHRLVAQQGHLHKCPHLAGVPLPRWPQMTHSESQQDLQKKVETPATSSREPSTGATVAPVLEATVTQTPVVETPAACSDTPAPMETGRAGDGQSWAERVKAGIDEEFQKDRPTKRCQSQSRRCEVRPTLSFPSKTVRGGTPLFCSSTNMRESSLRPTTMWPSKGSFISIRRCCRIRPGASEIRLSA